MCTDVVTWKIEKQRYTSFAIVLIALFSRGVSANPNAINVVSGQASARCAALANISFAQVQDAPTQILAAKLLEAHDDSPARCQVQGYVAPNVGFLLILPIGAWSG